MKKYPPIGPHKMGVDWNAALKTSGVAPSVAAKLVGAGQDTLGQPSTARPAGNAQNTPPSNAPLAGAGQDTLGHRRTNETRKTNTCCVACSTDKQGGNKIKKQRREHYPWILFGGRPFVRGRGGRGACPWQRSGVGWAGLVFAKPFNNTRNVWRNHEQPRSGNTRISL